MKSELDNMVNSAWGFQIGSNAFFNANDHTPEPARTYEVRVGFNEE